MPPGRSHRAPHERRTRIVAGAERNPDQAARPVVEHLRLRRACDHGGKFGAAARRRRDAPERLLVLSRRPIGRKGRHIAHRRPQRARTRRLERRELAERLHQRLEHALALGNRGRKTLEPQRGDGVGGNDPRLDADGDPGRQMRGARHIAGGSHSAGHGLDRPRRLETADQQRLLGLRPRQHLDRHLGHRRERAP